MIRGFFTVFYQIFPALFLLAALHTPAFATSEDIQTLELYYKPDDLVVSATRNPQPLSQTAENITVITAAQIEMMGAHTLPDVLNNVPGINIDDRGSVGTMSFITIQGSASFHVLVMLDGVMLNSFYSSDISTFSSIPVQNIERIEIIKGPGSSSWGSSLGGVVNIVTKSPRDDKQLGGSVSSSIGERTTRDTRGELSGTIDRFGYYLYGGNLASEGLNKHTAAELNSLYSKFRYDLPGQGSLAFTLAYSRSNQQDGEYPSYDFTIDNNNRYLLSTLALKYPLNDRLDLDLSFRGLWNQNNIILNSIDQTINYSDATGDETSYGGSVKLAWRQWIQSLAVGFDYDHVDVENSDVVYETYEKTSSDKWGVFLNDVFYFKGINLSVTPGVRYDQVHPIGDFVSPSIGLAWNPTDKITLRAYGARGYSLPIIKPDYTQEKVWTAQTGFETTYIPYLWFKTTFFLNYLSDIDNYNESLEHIRKQGVEVELKTVPLFNTSLSAGYTFIDAKNMEYGDIKDSPRHLLKMGIHYNDIRHSFKGSLLGRYVDWQASPDYNARYSAVIWDLNLEKSFHTFRDTELKLFFNAHNLFNGSQYGLDEIKNARRWFEGGIKFEF